MAKISIVGCVRPGFVKLNTDAAWNKASNNAGAGVVIRNEVGMVCGGLATRLSGSSALHVEAEAALRGLKLARRDGHDNVIVETDSKVLKQCIEGDTRNRGWTILPLILEIRQLAANFGSLEWNWIPRSANRAAHEAARIGSGAVAQVSWVDRPPPSLVSILVSDGLPGPPSV
ncbi:hypothetical protein CerSpe_228900 [Prunus speciosa]